ncbi:DUF2120 family protein [Methanobrevibacter sp.]|uniref:DUF2120 family protein n=1 Tax=Methanobrevibacter sp. TaxID=66852 RepID=UPI003D7EE1E2
MKKSYEIAGKVMGFFESFKGSRPAINNAKILIVRGRSRKTIPIDKFDSKLTELGELLGGTELSASSEEISKILKSGDQHIKESEGTTNTIDEHGFSRMKKELESMGLEVGYKVFKLPGFDVIVAIWEDRNGLPPLYVEVTVSEHED